jgi:hypothetical protein
MAKITKSQLKKQAEEILSLAQKRGVEQNYFFVTTFKRYQVQIAILEDLEKTIAKEPVLVEKGYVKDQKNLYIHPAITEFNKTSSAANQTVITLTNIVKNMSEDKNAAPANSLGENMKKLMENGK